jgi:hypothetical protein
MAQSWSVTAEVYATGQCATERVTLERTEHREIAIHQRSCMTLYSRVETG